MPAGIPHENLARLRPSELDSAKRLMSQCGLDLKVAAIKVFSDETEALR
jgi:hypothetical protein